MTPAQLRAAVTPRSKLLMLNSPSNPTGTVYTRQELEALADVVLETKLARPQRRDLREAGLRRRQGDLFRHAAAGAGRAHHHDQRGEQDLRHDRLAHGLGAGAGARHQGDGQRAEPADRQPVQHQPVRGAGRPGRRSGVRRDRCAASSRPGATWCAGGWRRCRACAVRSPDGAFYAFFDVSAHFGRTLGGRKVTDSAEFLHGGPGDGPRQPGARLGVRRRGLRAAVVRRPAASSCNGGLDRLEQWLQVRRSESRVAERNAGP